MQIKSGKSVFNLENEDKLHRAINGSIAGEGKSQGGVGENASDSEIIAEYDRLGGLITLTKETKRGSKSYKVKTGSFYDFGKKQARSKPEVVLSLRDIDGNEVEIEQDEEIPVEVQAAEKADKKPAKKAGKKEKEEEKKADLADDESEE